MTFDQKLNEILLRIRRAEKPMAIFAVDDKVFCVSSEGARFERMVHEPQAKFIGVYNAMIERDDLSCDISMIVDEFPEPDECKPKTMGCSTS